MNKYYVLFTNGLYFQNDYKGFWRESLGSATQFKSKKDAMKQAERYLYGNRDIHHIEVKMFITNESVTYYEV